MVPLGEPMLPLGDPMLPLGDPMLPLGDPMLPLGEPMVPLGEPMGPLGEPMAPLLGRTKTIFLRLAYCRRRFFFAQNSVSNGKTPFPSAGGLPQALFYGQK